MRERSSGHECQYRQSTKGMEKTWSIIKHSAVTALMTSLFCSITHIYGHPETDLQHVRSGYTAMLSSVTANMSDFMAADALSELHYDCEGHVMGHKGLTQGVAVASALRVLAALGVLPSSIENEFTFQGSNPNLLWSNVDGSLMTSPCAGMMYFDPKLSS